MAKLARSQSSRALTLIGAWAVTLALDLLWDVVNHSLASWTGVFGGSGLVKWTPISEVARWDAVEDAVIIGLAWIFWRAFRKLRVTLPAVIVGVFSLRSIYLTMIPFLYAFRYDHGRSFESLFREAGLSAALCMTSGLLVALLVRAMEVRGQSRLVTEVFE